MATLTGNITDVTGRTPESISNIIVKAPSARIGAGSDIIVTSNGHVAFNEDTGNLTLSGLHVGLSWLYIEGDGWSDSIPLAVAEGFQLILEAVANASGVPGIADYVLMIRNSESHARLLAQAAVDGEIGEVVRLAQTAATTAEQAATSADSRATYAEAKAGNAVSRVEALESMAGVSPESPVDGQTANLISQTGTLTSAAVTGKIESHVSDMVSSPVVTRILASLDPNAPLNEGDLLLVYAPARLIFQSLSTMDGLTPRWEGGAWDIAADESADGGTVLQLAGPAARRLVSLDEADGMRDVEIVSRMKMSQPSASSFGAGLAVRGSGEAGAENGYMALAVANGIRLAKFVNGAYSLIGQATAATIERNGWYWIRLRVEGTSILASLWADGEPEPAEWMVTVTDSSVTGGGWVGASTSTNTSTQSWDVIGVAELDTGEEKAPVSA